MLWKEGEAVLPVHLLANCKDIPSVGTRGSGRVQLTKSPLIALHAPQRPVSLRLLGRDPVLLLAMRTGANDWHSEPRS